jgi:single-strand DNA-binding protein
LFDTTLVIVGNVITAPEWRRLKESGSLVANFRVASTARRFDRDKAQWVDSNSLRVRVTAWRRLAEGVASSIAVGDPVVVYGRFYNRDWKDDQGNNRTSFEMEAFSIGHDLARGRAKFFRTRLAQMASETDSSETELFVRGEHSVPLTADEAPVTYGDGLPDQLAEDEPTFVDMPPGTVTRAEPSPEAASGSEEKTREKSEQEPHEKGEEETGERSEEETDDLTLEVERLVAEQQPASTRRRGRSPKRESVSV